MKLDILAFGAHPDDVELAASGTLIKHVKQGKKAGIVDLTRGELGTRGNMESRKTEAEESSKILGLSVRENLELPDGFLNEDDASLKKIIMSVRKYKPEIILCNALSDRHPDHGIAGKMVSRACFLSGLIKIDTNQEAWRPKAVYHYIQDHFILPDIVVDITEHYEERMKSVMAFKTQFYDPKSKEPETPISSKDFIGHLTGRFLQMGRLINVKYGEGFTVERPVGTDDLMGLM